MTQPAVGVVAGSGLDLTAVLDTVDGERSFSEFPELPGAAVAGHLGRFSFGSIGDIPAIVQSGRLHFYEGLDFPHVVKPVDLLHRLGARTILLTNAAGGLDPQMSPGDLMAVERVTLWPYRNWPGQPHEIVPDFEVAECDWRGAYHWVHGPCYETRAEIGALRALGSSAVGMSTAAEMARARELEMRVAAVSCITNNCCTPQVLTHDHVVRTAAAASARLCGLLREAIVREARRADRAVTRNSSPSSR